MTGAHFAPLARILPRLGLSGSAAATGTVGLGAVLAGVTTSWLPARSLAPGVSARAQRAPVVRFRHKALTRRMSEVRVGNTARTRTQRDPLPALKIDQVAAQLILMLTDAELIPFGVGKDGPDVSRAFVVGNDPGTQRSQPLDRIGVRFAGQIDVQAVLARAAQQPAAA